MIKRNELVLKLRKSIIDHTNRRGYVDINEEIVSDILTDLESLITIEYHPQETSNDQLEFDI